MMTDVSVSVLDPARSLVVEPVERRALSSDASLLERFQRGENAALVELFDRHNERLQVYARKILGDAELSHDITQEVWIRVLGLRSRPRRIDNPVGFLLRIARNLCLSALSRRRVHESLDSIPEPMRPAEPERTALEEIAIAALDELPFDYREVLVLTVYCGYSTEETACMLEKSPEAIWKRASRARAMLRAAVLSETSGGRATP
jgi:RNA polymerase sigma-70 factor (ECF subfamily)